MSLDRGSVVAGLHIGFRRSNCFDLRWAGGVTFEAGTIRARDPKGDRDYHVPMNDELQAILCAG